MLRAFITKFERTVSVSYDKVVMNTKPKTALGRLITTAKTIMVEERSTSTPFLAQQLYVSAATAGGVVRNNRDIFLSIKKTSRSRCYGKNLIPFAK